MELVVAQIQRRVDGLFEGFKIDIDLASSSVLAVPQ
jgi:hypothetical protein